MTEWMTLLPEYVTYAGFGLAWGIHMGTSWSYGALARHHAKTKCKTKDRSEQIAPISVILTVHNQYEALKNHLHTFLEQDYERYEVVVVDNASTDETEELLKAYELRYPHLRHTTIRTGARYISMQRLALTIGFKGASYEWCLHTEAGCRPSSAQWLRQMAFHFAPNVNIVLGYGNYHSSRYLSCRNTAFFNLYHQLHYLNWALHHRAYRANPINIAYRKSYFLENKGFAEDIHLMAGAMELLVNRHSNRENTRVCIGPEAVIEDHRNLGTETLKKERTFYMETRRHFIHTKLYRCAFNTKQWIVPLFHILTALALTQSILLQQWYAMAIIITLFVCVTGMKTFLFNQSSRCLGEHVRFFDLWIGEWSIPFMNLTSWVRYRLSPQKQFHRKAF